MRADGTPDVIATRDASATVIAAATSWGTDRGVARVRVDNRPAERRAILFGSHAEIALVELATLQLDEDGDAVATVEGLLGDQPAFQDPHVAPGADTPIVMAQELPPEIVLSHMDDNLTWSEPAINALQLLFQGMGYRVRRLDGATVADWATAFAARPRAFIHIGHGAPQGFLLQGGFWWSKWWKEFDLGRTIFTASSCQVRRPPNGPAMQHARATALGEVNQISPFVDRALVVLWTEALGGTPLDKALARGLDEEYSQLFPVKASDNVIYWITPTTGIQWSGYSGVFGPPGLEDLPPEEPEPEPVEPPEWPEDEDEAPPEPDWPPEPEPPGWPPEPVPDLPPQGPPPELPPPPVVARGGSGGLMLAAGVGVAAVGVVTVVALANNTKKRRPRRRRRP